MSNQDFDNQQQSIDCINDCLIKDGSLPQQSVRPPEKSNMFNGFFSWEGRYNGMEYIVLKKVMNMEQKPTNLLACSKKISTIGFFNI